MADSNTHLDTTLDLNSKQVESTLDAQEPRAQAQAQAHDRAQAQAQTKARHQAQAKAESEEKNELYGRLNVIESNNLESLADVCAMIMASYPLSDVFMPEKIVVMNLGMKNFVSQRITAQNKISALCDYTQVWQLIFSLFYELNTEYTSIVSDYLGQMDALAQDLAFEDIRYNFYDREHLKWNIYSQICRRPKQDLKQFVSDYENGFIERKDAQEEILKFFDPEGVYTINSAKAWIKHADELEAEAEANAEAQAQAQAQSQAQGNGQGQQAQGQAHAQDGNQAGGTQAGATAGGTAGVVIRGQAKAACSEDQLWSFVDLDSSDIFERIKDYVRHDHSDERAYELAAKLADTFDQYQIYRPHWIADWNKFTIQDFADYEANPEDPRNPINRFIDEQCQRYAQRKSGLIAANRRKVARALEGVDGVEGSGDGAGNSETLSAQSSQAAASDALLESSLAVSELRRAQAALSEAEQEQATLKATVETIRNTFKQNVWQMKLWCILRPSLELPLKSHNFDQNKRRRLQWFMAHLDRSQILYAMISQLERTKVKLPFERVFIFGVSSLPQVVIDFFNSLSRHCQVFLMLFNPSHLFWADIRSSHRESFKDYIQHIQATRDAPKPYLLKMNRKFVTMPSLLKTLKREDYDNSGERIDGHPLLLSYGRQCKDMLNMLLDVDPPISSVACFSEPLEDGEFERSLQSSELREPYTIVRGGSLLKYLQTTIFNLDEEKERYEISPHDRSLVIHSCYTIRREVESLKDALLRLFNEHRCPYRQNNNYCTIRSHGKDCEYCSNRNRCQRTDLLPRDVVVMVPAINTYAPHISAVFGGVAPGAPDYIPFVISDQTETEANTVAAALLRLLEINSERITSVLVIELLNEPAIAKRFGMDAEDVDVISSWLTLNNVYWGLDEDDTKVESEIDVPGTFSHGLDRMLLGSLVGEAHEVPCFTEIEGMDERLLGKFWDFLQALRELRTHFTPELQQTPHDWEILLQQKLRDRFFDQSENTLRSLRCVDDFITRLQFVFSHLKKAPRLTLKVFAAALRQGLTAVRNFTPYYGERVNFCSLIPMRAVPFKHVFILGLNDVDFPRQSVAPAFDLIGSKEMFERGDRSPALDDRFLFLEAILSARESLYLSYIGQSPIDQSERNPSLVLSELLYYINDKCQLPLPDDAQARRAMELDPGKAVLARIVIKDRLNAYHSANYQVSAEDQQALDAYLKSAQDKLWQDAQAQAQEAATAAKAKADAKVKAKAKGKGRAKALGQTQEQADVPPYTLEPYATVLEHNPIWSMPSFNRSFINVQQSIPCEIPVLGAGNFGALVGLPEQQVVDLRRIFAFCKKPCKSFMQSQLRMSLDVDNKTELSSDEVFDFSGLSRITAVGDLVDCKAGLQEAYIDYQSEKGAFPYGVFKDLLKQQLLDNYQKIYKAMMVFEVSNAQQIEQLPSGTHYEMDLIIPEDAIYGSSTLSPREILEKYNAQTSTTLHVVREGLTPNTHVSDDPELELALNPAELVVATDAGSAADAADDRAANEADSEAGSGAGLVEAGTGQAVAGGEQVIPSILDSLESSRLSNLEKARPRLRGANGEALLKLHVTLQFSARTRPLVIDHFSRIASKPQSQDKSGAIDEKWVKTALKKDSNIIFSALNEAIAQYLFEPVEDDSAQAALAKAAEKGEVVLNAAHVAKDSPGYIPACTKERLQDITIIDREGKVASFTKFSSGDELIFILQQLVIFYLQSSCAPYPGGKTILSNLELFDDGHVEQSSDLDVDPTLSYDREAAYFFGNVKNILGSPYLSARAQNLMNFIKDDLLPHYQPCDELVGGE